MDYTVLGRTGMKVSVAGLGCGGHSRLGQSRGATEQESVRVVRRALELGVTHVDTAAAYGTEEIVGKGIEHQRDRVVISTKVRPRTRDGVAISGTDVRDTVHQSLRRLRTDTIDLLYLHGVLESDYDRCVNELLPEVLRLQSQGHVRFIGITESFNIDPSHLTLRRALQDDYWDVMMIGFNILNPSARRLIMPETMKRNIGTTAMYAVRRALASPEELSEVVRRLVSEGFVNAEEVDLSDPLGFLVHAGGASSVVDAAYRFVRHEPGLHVTLTGTGNTEHLEHNVRSINRPRLPASDLSALAHLFGHIEHLAISTDRRPTLAREGGRPLQESS